MVTIDRYMVTIDRYRVTIDRKKEERKIEHEWSFHCKNLKVTLLYNKDR